MRDCRISPACNEGTNGKFKALDLLGRKVLMSQGKCSAPSPRKLHQFCQANRKVMRPWWTYVPS